MLLNLLLLFLLQISEWARAWVGSFAGDCDTDSTQQRHTNTWCAPEATG